MVAEVFHQSCQAKTIAAGETGGQIETIQENVVDSSIAPLLG